MLPEIQTDLMNHMLPNIPEFVLRKRLPQELNSAMLKNNSNIDTLTIMIHWKCTPGCYELSIKLPIQIKQKIH
jgi:hypothetical protein